MLHNKVNCKITKSGDQLKSIIGIPPIFATSNTCVNDLQLFFNFKILKYKEVSHFALF